MRALASELYGGNPLRQPTPTGTADHVGSPEPFARTVAPGTANSTLVLVAIIGLAALLINFSVRFEVAG